MELLEAAVEILAIPARLIVDLGIYFLMNLDGRGFIHHPRQPGH